LLSDVLFKSSHAATLMPNEASRAGSLRSVFRTTRPLQSAVTRASPATWLGMLSMTSILVAGVSVCLPRISIPEQLTLSVVPLNQRLSPTLRYLTGKRSGKRFARISGVSVDKQTAPVFLIQSTYFDA
jgi:hypothetical protein